MTVQPVPSPIAVIGDLIFDEFVEASAHPSIETPPAPIYVERETKTFVGGAGLVALAAVEYSRGGDVHLVHPVPNVRDLDGTGRLRTRASGAVHGHRSKTRSTHTRG